MTSSSLRGRPPAPVVFRTKPHVWLGLKHRVIRIPGEGLGLDSCAVAKRLGWCAMSRGGGLWRGLLVI